MKKTNKKLFLSRDTVRTLNSSLRKARGGAGGDDNGDTVIDTVEATRTLTSIVQKTQYWCPSAWC